MPQPSIATRTEEALAIGLKTEIQGSPGASDGNAAVQRNHLSEISQSGPVSSGTFTSRTSNSPGSATDQVHLHNIQIPVILLKTELPGAEGDPYRAHLEHLEHEIPAPKATSTPSSADEPPAPSSGTKLRFGPLQFVPVLDTTLDHTAIEKLVTLILTGSFHSSSITSETGTTTPTPCPGILRPLQNSARSSKYQDIKSELNCDPESQSQPPKLCETASAKYGAIVFTSARAVEAFGCALQRVRSKNPSPQVQSASSIRLDSEHQDQPHDVNQKPLFPIDPQQRSFFSPNFPIYVVGPATARAVCGLPDLLCTKSPGPSGQQKPDRSSDPSTTVASPYHPQDPTGIDPSPSSSSSVSQIPPCRSPSLSLPTHAHSTLHQPGLRHAPLGGVVIIGESTGHGEALAELIIRDYPDRVSDPRSRPILFLAGQKHRAVIPDRLCRRGWTVHEQVVYSTTETAPNNHKILDCLAQIQEKASLDRSKQISDSGSSIDSGSDSSSRLESSSFISRFITVVVVFSPAGCPGLIQDLSLHRSSQFATLVPKGRCYNPHHDIIVAAIGPTTEAHLIKNYNFRPQVIAESPSPAGLTAGIISYILKLYKS